MSKETKKKLNGVAHLLIATVAGIALNVLLSFLVYRLELPLWMDTVGTVAAAGMGGVLAGVIVAVGTSIFTSFFNTYAIYYSLVAVIIALLTAYFVWKQNYKIKSKILVYVFGISAVGGILGGIFQWILIGGPQLNSVAETANLMTEKTGIGYFFTSLLLNIGLNIVDKFITVALALLVVMVVPKDFRETLWNSCWKQKPLTEAEIKEIRTSRKRGSSSLQRRLSIMLGMATLAVTVVLTIISINLYFVNMRENYGVSAQKAAAFVASIVDGDKIGAYIRNGANEEGYEQTKTMMYRAREAANNVKYLYVLKIEADGCTAVFDLDLDDEAGYEPGEAMPVEEAFKPYLEDLLKGEEVPVIESKDDWGWLLTAYKPITDSDGKVVAYAGADVSMELLSDYTNGFFVKVLLIFSGFLVLILCYGAWISRYNLVYPIGSLTDASNDFIDGSEEQVELDRKIEHLESLDIQTGDEVEALYKSVCHMASGMAEQMRDIRHYADATAKMQNGLIITMANMVENRDSDTGAHIQKTAAYVKIIAEGLRKKGYYTDKLTDKYVSDIVMSAPLHDVGKINIPDAVLNKPGKLTDEEYVIMKTHTTAGKKIIENAISTIQGESYLKEARNMAGYHHERWDGKGYPEGLAGEVIPLSARIMSVADVFDALTSPRVYKPAFPLEKALDILNEGKGTQFDPKCIEVFMNSLTEVKIILKKYQQL